MFIENYVIKGIINCKTGLYIGGSSDNIDIGGSDNPVIRDSISGLPYIPGSSIKGKLRALLELNDKECSQYLIDNENDNVVDDERYISAKLFGVSSNKKNSLKFPTRTIVRDSFATKDTVELWENSEGLLNGTEFKWENNINRLSAHATPRNIERVPRGSKFNFEIIFSVYENDDKKDIVRLLESMILLEDSYLGGSGSRGSGQIAFENITFSKRNREFYIESNNEKVLVPDGNVNDCIKKILE